ncbi:MAG: hypothetical protein AB7I01_24095, partial [Gammaproteobacteria bacterium]
AAGGLHAAAIGSRLRSPQVIVPSFFPVFSAFGLMSTDIRHAYTLTDDAVKLDLAGEDALALTAKAEYVTARLREVAVRPLSLLANEAVADADREVVLALDMRYAGQVLELATTLPANVLVEGMDGAGLAAVLADWMAKYKRVYGEGAAWQDGQIEIINYRAVGIGRIARPQLPHLATHAPRMTARRNIYLGHWVEAEVWPEHALHGGARIDGPAVIEGPLRTVVIGPGDRATIDQYGHLLLTPGGQWEW